MFLFDFKQIKPVDLIPSSTCRPAGQSHSTILDMRALWNSCFCMVYCPSKPATDIESSLTKEQPCINTTSKAKNVQVLLIPLEPKITSLIFLSQFPTYFTLAIHNHALKTVPSRLTETEL